ncbi:hypothetical protein GOV06_02305 [Candidatus Woesearchaeota archaeon]|nr:hypothetical protein [Candidatus Woesearchaeota archaeon]
MDNKKLKIRERCKFPHNELFFTALISLIIFLMMELFVRSFNLYKHLPFVDIPSHFFAGIALFIGIYWVLSLTAIIRKKTWAILLTFIASIFWEILETLEDLVLPNPSYLKDIFFWDGFWDIIVAIIGGLFGIGILYALKYRTLFFKELKFR